MKEYKIIDCERVVMEAMIEKNVKEGWDLGLVEHIETHAGVDNHVYRMYMIILSRDKEA